MTMLAEVKTNTVAAQPPFAPVSTSFVVTDIREGRFTVTAATAKHILADFNYDRQRPIRAPHVAFLADEMRRDCFIGGTQMVFANLGDKFILVNGQHRLTAQVVSGATVEYQVLVQHAETMEDVARLYYRQDRGGRARSDNELLAAVGVGSAYGLQSKFARNVFTAVPVINNGFVKATASTDPTLRNDDMRLEACKPWWPIAESYGYITAAAPRYVRRKLESASCLAVGLVTLKHQPEQARLFWEGIAKDDGLQRNDPRKALLVSFANRDWLNKATDGATAASLAWNAFFAGRQLSTVKIHAASGIRILGTPYDGKRH